MNKLNIRYYLSGILVSMLGSQLFLIAMSIWLIQEYGSTLKLGVFLFLSTITTVIISPFVGVLIDRFNPKKIMIISDCVSGLMMIFIAAMMGELIKTPFNIELIFLCTFVSSCMSAAFTPSSLALVALITDKENIREINGRASNLTEVSKLIGRSLAGVLLFVISAPFLIFLNGVSFLISAFFETKITLSETSMPPKKVPSKYFKELTEGAKYLMSNHLAVGLFIGAAFTNFFMAINATFLPVIFKDILFLDLNWFGIVMSATGAGALIGGFLARKLKTSLVKKIFPYVLISQGLPFFFVPFCKLPVGIFILMFIVGLGFVFVQVNMLTLISNIVKESFRGRIFSLMYMVVSLFIPLSYLFTGFIGDHYKELIFSVYHFGGLFVPLLWMIILFFLNKKDHLKGLRI